MQFTREIQRLLLGILVILCMIAIIATYWAAVGSENILRRDDNPRLFEARARIVRGEIVDRRGETLVTTVSERGRRAVRQYLYPAMNSVLGYYSLRYGVDGVEAAYDTLLSGADLETNVTTYFTRDLLHLPQQGTDIRLTLDLGVQQAVVDAMGEHRGAAVVLSVPGGEVLALVSLPTYDPNTLDTEWERLIETPGNPFFNRVLQGNYQLGGTMQTMLILAALLQDMPLDTPYDGAAQPVFTADVTLECVTQPHSTTLTLREAYQYGCPAPFIDLLDTLGTETIANTFNLFQFHQPITLPGFVNPDTLPAPVTTPEAQPFPLDLNEIMGQGSTTVTPLHMAAITAAIINNGNAPQPYILLETQAPNADEWSPIRAIRPTLPITTQATTQQLQTLMRQAVNDGSAKAAARAGLDIGGHTALAYSGDETKAWFIGFAQTEILEGVVVAVVLENTSDVDLVSDIGGTALETAINALLNNPDE